ncbi:MAG: hypothetical protein M0Q38_17465 [Bacteroidales bacterium]|jgi:hypothetical protein|nr:hypothetical protein [Bacteroidales bacterium]
MKTQHQIQVLAALDELGQGLGRMELLDQDNRTIQKNRTAISGIVCLKSIY